MLLYISLFGIFLSLLLLYFNGRNYPASRYLGFYFLFLSIYGVNQFVVLSSKSVFWVSIFTTNFTCFAYLVGPLSFLYIRSVITDNAQLRKSDVLHLLPMLFYLTAALPYIFSSYAFKTKIAKSIVADVGFLGQYKFTILTEWFSSTAVYLSRPGLVLLYALFSGALLFKYFSSKRKSNTPHSEGFIKNWLITFFGFQFLLVVSHLLYISESFGVGSSVLTLSEDVINFLSSIGMIGLLVSPLLFPRILYGLPNLSNVPNYPVPAEVLLKEEVVRKAPAYDDDYMSFIQSKVAAAMKEHQIYLQKEFNLSQLSVFMQVPTHHLAYYFANFRQQSFNDYRNEFRIRYAKLLILQEQSENVTLEAIGLMSGFSNRNNFAKAFKEIERVTPSVFAAQNKRKLRG